MVFKVSILTDRQTDMATSTRLLTLFRIQIFCGVCGWHKVIIAYYLMGGGWQCIEKDYPTKLGTYINIFTYILSSVCHLQLVTTKLKFFCWVRYLSLRSILITFHELLISLYQLFKLTPKIFKFRYDYFFLDNNNNKSSYI